MLGENPPLVWKSLTFFFSSFSRCSFSSFSLSSNKSGFSCCYTNVPLKIKSAASIASLNTFQASLTWLPIMHTANHLDKPAFGSNHRNPFGWAKSLNPSSIDFCIKHVFLQLTTINELDVYSLIWLWKW